MAVGGLTVDFKPGILKIHSNKAEVFKNENWFEVQDFPAKYVYGSATVYFEDFFYYFGQSLGETDEIYRLGPESSPTATWTWNQVGNLNNDRYGHSAIVVQNKIMVVGGLPNFKGKVFFSNEKGLYHIKKLEIVDMAANKPLDLTLSTEVCELTQDEIFDCTNQAKGFA